MNEKMNKDNIREKKHFCLIYEFLSEPGGIERVMINHARFLKEEGYNVTILTCYLDPKILKIMPFEGLKVSSIGRINTGIESLDMALCFLGINKIKKYNPAAFLSYSFPSNYIIRKKRAKRIDYVSHYPNFLYLSKKERAEWSSSTRGIKRKIAFLLSLFFGNYLKKLDKKLFLKNDLVFMNSKYTQRRLEKLYNVKNTIVSYPPLDKRFDNPPKASIKEKFVFSCGRIIPDKKYEWLIETISFLKNKRPLYIAGSIENSYKKKLENLAKKNNVKLKFLGRLVTEELLKYYASAEVFAFPAPKEDFGLVPAESLACGTPVVVWGDGAGPTEQVIDGITGYLAKPYDIKDFAKKIDLCIEKKLKSKNKKKIIDSAKKFKYGSIKKDFISQIKKLVG